MTSSQEVGRPRTAGRLDLPDNLVPRPRNLADGRTVTYWYWFDPRDRQEKSLKCPGDRETAIQRAEALNALAAREMADQVIHDLSETPGRIALTGTPFDAYAAHHLDLLEQRGLKPNTLKTRRSLLNSGIRRFQDRPMQDIGVPDMAGLLKHYTDQGKNRYAQALRSALTDMWRDAQQEGLLPADHPNPAALTRRPDAKVQRARLTLDAFNTILESSEKMAKRRGAWAPNSKLLALVTGQRREDLVIAQFRRGADWLPAWKAYQLGDKHPIHPYPHVHEGYFWVIQQKTGALVKIPLSLRLDAVGLSVGDVIERCRRSGVASRYLLHHTVAFANAPLGSPISIDRVSHTFADARARTDLEWPGKNPPTYHEIRSLSERLYKAQGANAQAIMGHKHARTTEKYDDPRQAEWVTIDIGGQ